MNWDRILPRSIAKARDFWKSGSFQRETTRARMVSVIVALTIFQPLVWNGLLRYHIPNPFVII